MPEYLCYISQRPCRLVAELTPPHAQSAWGSRGEMVRVVGLAACCNYL